MLTRNFWNQARGTLLLPDLAVYSAEEGLSEFVPETASVGQRHPQVLSTFLDNTGIV